MEPNRAGGGFRGHSPESLMRVVRRAIQRANQSLKILLLQQQLDRGAFEIAVPSYAGGLKTLVSLNVKRRTASFD